MTISVYIVIALLIITKICDVVSTIQRISHPHGETNPIAQRMMLRFGMIRATWGVFVLSLIIIGVAGLAALTGSFMMQLLFIAAGVVISFVQGSVAHCNWTGRENGVTRWVRVLHICRR